MKEKKDEDVDKAKERDCFFIYKNWLMSMRYISRETIGSIMMCILNYTEKGIPRQVSLNSRRGARDRMKHVNG